MQPKLDNSNLIDIPVEELRQLRFLFKKRQHLFLDACVGEISKRARKSESQVRKEIEKYTRGGSVNNTTWDTILQVMEQELREIGPLGFEAEAKSKKYILEYSKKVDFSKEPTKITHSNYNANFIEFMKVGFQTISCVILNNHTLVLMDSSMRTTYQKISFRRDFEKQLLADLHQKDPDVLAKEMNLRSATADPIKGRTHRTRAETPIKPHEFDVMAYAGFLKKKKRNFGLIIRSNRLRSNNKESQINYRDTSTINDGNISGELEESCVTLGESCISNTNNSGKTSKTSKIPSWAGERNKPRRGSRLRRESKVIDRKRPIKRRESSVKHSSRLQAMETYRTNIIHESKQKEAFGSPKSRASRGSRVSKTGSHIDFNSISASRAGSIKPDILSKTKPRYSIMRYRSMHSKETPGQVLEKQMVKVDNLILTLKSKLKKYEDKRDSLYYSQEEKKLIRQFFRQFLRIVGPSETQECLIPYLKSSDISVDKINDYTLEDFAKIIEQQVEFEKQEEFFAGTSSFQ